jgi:glycosyltransferase involved in cell wall biosynthesis
LKHLVFFTLSPIPYGENITDGSGFRIWSLANYLKQSYRITIFSLYNSYTKGSKEFCNIDQDGLQIREIPYKPTTVAHCLSDAKPDILVFSNWSSYIFSSWYKCNIPIIMDYVGPSLMENIMFKRTNLSVLSRLKMRSFRIADQMLTTTNRLRYYLLGSMIKSGRLHNYSVGDPVVKVVPIFPPNNSLTLTDHEKSKSAEFTILLPGAVIPWYDYSTVLRALSMLKENGRIFKLVVMGDVSPSLKFDGVRKILQEAADLGLKNHINVTGLVPFRNRGQYYAAADVAIIPNMNTLENELSARTRVVDCFWGNIPIVTPGGDEYSESAIRSGCAFRYPYNDPSSLCMTLKHLYENKDTLAKARKSIVTLVAKEFNPDVFIPPLMRAINEAPTETQNKLFSKTDGLLPYFKYIANQAKGR